MFSFFLFCVVGTTCVLQCIHVVTSPVLGLAGILICFESVYSWESLREDVRMTQEPWSGPRPWDRRRLLQQPSSAEAPAPGIVRRCKTSADNRSSTSARWLRMINGEWHLHLPWFNVLCGWPRSATCQDKLRYHSIFYHIGGSEFRAHCLDIGLICCWNLSLRKHRKILTASDLHFAAVCRPLTQLGFVPNQPTEARSYSCVNCDLVFPVIGCVIVIFLMHKIRVLWSSEKYETTDFQHGGIQDGGPHEFVNKGIFFVFDQEFQWNLRTLVGHIVVLGQE